MKKAFSYFALAAAQNHSKAQYCLGELYEIGIHVQRDINKAIHYYLLSANQNNSSAQFRLGLIYTDSVLVPKDPSKANYYFKLAASHADSIESNYVLGLLYYEGISFTRDIKKALNYFTIAANQGHAYSQYIIGFIYYEGKYVVKDIKKAVFYFTLAANSNHSDAQFFLGVFYSIGQDASAFNSEKNSRKVKRILNIDNSDDNDDNDEEILDVKKAIDFLSSHANKENKENDEEYDSTKVDQLLSQSEKKKKYGKNNDDPKPKKDIKKDKVTDRPNNKKSKNVNPINAERAIHFLTRSAIQGNRNAQFLLGIYYLYGHFLPQNLNKSIFYFTLSARNRNIYAFYELGCIYHFGIGVHKDINKAILNYQESSSFNMAFAKNNLGIIHKNGFGDEIPKNIANAIVYFREAINQKNDMVAMYNLAHCYLYDDPSDENINKAINLLIRSHNRGFYISSILLSFILIKRSGFNIENIINEINKYKIKGKIFVLMLIKKFKLDNELEFNEYYQKFKSIDFSYDFMLKIVESSSYLTPKKNKDTKIPKNITDLFYEGFGII